MLREGHGEDLGCHDGAVFPQRLLCFRPVRRPPDLDAVGDVQAGGLAGILEDPHHVPGDAGALQRGSDLQVEGDGEA